MCSGGLLCASGLHRSVRESGWGFMEARGFACIRLAAGLPISWDLLHFALAGRMIQQAEGRRITRSALSRYQRSPYGLALEGQCR
jgi:hypothetical protein